MPKYHFLKFDLESKYTYPYVSCDDTLRLANGMRGDSHMIVGIGQLGESHDHMGVFKRGESHMIT